MNRWVLWVAIGSLVAGCETTQRARDAQADKSRLPGEVTVAASEAGITEGSSYSLEDLERIALSYHPSVCQATQALESARAQLMMTRSGWMPQVSASGGYKRSTANTAGRNPYSAKTSGSWSGSLGLDQLLYDFGKLDAAERQSVEAIAAAECQLRQTQIDVVYAVRTAFFGLHRKVHLLTVAQESERQYAVHLDEAKSMLEVGTRMKYDVTKANVDWGNARLDVITASNNVITAKAELCAALGLADSTRFEIKDAELPKDEVELGTDSLMAIARENTPSLAVLRAKERAASSAVDEMIADLYPSISAGLSFDLSGRSFPLAWNFSWLGQAAETVFNGKKNLAQIDQAVADLRTARANLAEAEQTLYKDLVTALAARDSARESSAIAKMVADQAKENLDIVEEQYRIGTSSSVERTDAQVTFTQSKAKVVTAYYDEQDAQAKIADLIGIVPDSTKAR